MKVVHVSLAKGFRGGEAQVLYLIEALQARGVEQLLLAPPEGPLATRVKALGVAVHSARNRLQATWQLRRLGQTTSVIVHAHDGHAHTAAWAAAELGANARVVVSRRVARAPKRGSRKYTHPRIKALLCVSQAVASLHLNALGDAVNVMLVYDAVAQPYAEMSAACSLRQELGLAGDTELVGTVAALTSEKDTFTFVKTCAAVAINHPEAHFVHVGTGTPAEVAGLAAHVDQLGLTGRFHALGFRADASMLSGQFDVFVFTSRWEGLGSAILQAQVRGTPVVSTAAGGTTELIEAGVSGQLAPVGDVAALAAAVSEILSNDSLAARFSRAGKLSAAQFSIERMVGATLAAYQG